MDDTYQINHHWKKLASQVVKPKQVVLVIGATDVGKSTFCRFLVDSAIERGLHTAFVDTDVGQSRIGPPTTIGMKSFSPKSSTRQFNAIADQLYFVGDLSPRGHYLEMLTGARLMVDSARETNADFIVVDTTGYIHDASAVILKQHKIELIRPSHVVCMGRSSELEQIAACYSQQEWLDVHYLLPHPNVRPKSNKVRSQYRQAQFDAYFDEACESKLAVRRDEACEPETRLQKSEGSIQQLPFGQIRGGRTPFFIGRIANEKELETLSRLAETEIHYAEWGPRTLCLVASTPLSKAIITHIKNYLSLTRITTEVSSYFKRRLVGLIDRTGNTYAIGIIEAVDFQKREFSIRSKTDAVEQACAIQLGSYQLQPELKNL